MTTCLPELAAADHSVCEADALQIPTEFLTRGRCLFCDERCEVNTYWHGYCREDYEWEQRSGMLVRSRRNNAA